MKSGSKPSFDLSTGPVRAHLLRISGMIFMGMLAQTAYMLVDQYWVGRLGDTAIAAVGLAGNLMMLVLALTQMLSVGTVALVAQAIGAQDHARAQHCFGQSQSLGGIGALLFLLICFTGREAYAASLSADAETARACLEYLAWFVPSMALQFPLVTMGSALRGAGDVRPGMLIQLMTVGLNIVLAPLLIFGWVGLPRLGVAGAGLATFIAVLVGVLWQALYFQRARAPLKWTGLSLRPDLGVWRRLVAIGLPSGGEFLLMFLYMIVVFGLIRSFGPEAQAGFGVGQRVLQAGLLPGLAVSFAAAALAGQSYGARNPVRLRETFREALRLSLVYMISLLLLLHFLPQALLHPFAEDAEVVAYGSEFLRIIAWNLIATAVVFSCGAVFQGVGNTWPALAASAVRMALVVLPGLWLAQRPGFVLAQIWHLSVAATVVQMVLNLVFMHLVLRRRLPLVPAPA